MYLEERLKFIKDLLDKKNRVKVSELSDILDVSEVTIRKDLKELEERNFVKRTHGGAIKVRKNVEGLAVENKKVLNTKLKESISQLASKLIVDSITIFLDAGTTTYYLIDYIAKYKDITVITYDLEIALVLSKYDNIRTYLLGGYIENKTKTSLSIDGYETLSKFHADICFMGTDAYDSRRVYSTSENKGKIKGKMIENSEIKVLMTDTSKYPSTGLYSFANIEDFNYFITEDTKKL